MIRNRENLERPISKRGTISLLSKMPMGFVLNSCSCAYIDSLLTHSSVHRGKPHSFMIQRLVVICGRSSSTVPNHAANIILSAFNFCHIEAPAKKFLDEEAALSLFHTILSYSTVNHTARSGIEILGAQRLTSALCDLIACYTRTMQEIEASKALTHLCKKLASVYDPLVVLPFISKLAKSRRLRQYLQPLFLGHCDYTTDVWGVSPESVEIYNHIARGNFSTPTLIEIVQTFLEKEVKEVIISSSTDPVKLVQYLISCSNPENAEIVQALAFLLYSNTKMLPQGACGAIDMDVQAADTITTSRLSDPKFTQPVKDALMDSGREALQRRLSIYGPPVLRSAEIFVEELKQAPIQRQLITNASISYALHYILQFNVELSQEVENGTYDDPEYYNAVNFVIGVIRFVEDQQIVNETNSETYDWYPDIDWTEVVKDFDSDHVPFCRQTIILFSEIFPIMFQYEPENFPISFFVTPWKCWEQQLHLYECMIECADIWNISQYPHTKVLTPDLNLKTIPDDTTSIVQLWNCQEFSNCLLTIAHMQPGTINGIKQFFNVGSIHAGDVSMLALLLSSTQWTSSRQELIRHFLPQFILKSPNVTPILNLAWNDPTLCKHMRQNILSCLTSMYTADSTQLAKILDVAHDVKPTGLSELLNQPVKHLPFMVDLACLASKRDYLNLEKWIEDKEKALGEPMTVAILQYIQKRYQHSQLAAALAPNAQATIPSSPSNPIHVLIPFVNKKAKKALRQQYPLVFQVMKENSGRSSSVSSGGHQNVQQAGGSQPQQFGNISGLPPSGVVPSQQQPLPPPSLQQQLSQQALQTLSTPSQQHNQTVPGPIQRPAQFAPQSMFPSQVQAQQHPHMMGQPPPGAPQNAQPGMNLLLNMGQFAPGNNRDLLKVVQPAPPPPPSMSPASQMMRSLIPPLAQRQNSNPGWHAAPAQPQQRPPGPPTPQQQMDFRAQIQEFAPSGPNQLQRSGSVSGRSMGSGAHKSVSGGTFSVGAPIAGSAAAAAAAASQQSNNEDFSSMTFSEDIQEEANGYFEKIYSVNNAMSVDGLIDLLKKFKAGDRRERSVLACVVKNLSEEYRFFHEYPERELRTTAAVYGGIIREDIISNVQFATAVRKVIESLSADPNTMLWTFGIVSLQHCRSKLCAYPKVCQMIMSSENFSKFPQLLKDYVIAGVKGELPPEGGRHTPVGASAPSGSVSSTPTPATAPTNWGAVARAASVDPKNSVPANRTGNVLSYTNVDTLVLATNKDGAEIAQPAESIVDKISFLFNNLSQTNLVQKKDEVLDMIAEHGEGFTRWLAQYIVMKRVSIEQNFQPLYNQFVTAIDSTYLDQCIKRETFRNIRILLRSDKKTTVASNYSDRQLLKNLGSWLGAITIARNKPILLNDLDLKSLLLEAYYKGQAELLFVVPFISKILTACSKTALFTPTCAWIKSILKVLAELHNEPDLKINLKFEIEVLCKELNVDLSQLPMDGILKDTEKLVRVPQQLCEVKVLGRPEAASPVQSQIRMSGSAEQLSGMSPAIPDQVKPATPQPAETDIQIGAGGAGSQGTEAQVVPNVTHFAYHDINVLTYDGLIPHVKIVSHLPLFQLHPHAKHLVRPAMIHAIKELIGPVTERALKIAMTVTESLVRKDFALDPEEQNLRAASFHMMRAMTAGMAMITCRDPLASTMHSNLAQAFSSSLRSTGANPEMKQMIEDASSTITQDNVELSTNFIVKTACEKATQEIEKRLEADYQKRIAAKAEGTAYRDEAAAAIHAQLPKAISTQPGPTGKALMSIYDQFSSRICGFKANAGDDPLSADPVSGTMTPVQTQSKEMEIVCQQLQIIIKEVDQTTQAQPHLSNPAFQTVCLMREMMQSVLSTKDANHLLTLVTRSTEHLLHAYRLEGSPAKNLLDVEWARRLRDLFIGLMRLLQNYFPLVELSRRITTAIMQIRSDYKWNMEGIEILFKQNLLQSVLWDQHLAGSMDNGGNMEAVLFAQKFVRSIGGGDLTRIQFLKERFPLTCDQLTKLHQLQSATRTEGINNGTGSAAHHHSGIQQQQPVTLPMEAAPMPQASAEAMAQRGYDDQEMTAKVEIIMREWIGLCYSPTGQRSPQESLAQMIQLMHEHGVLATDDKITQFFRLCVENCVDISVRVMKSEQLANGLPTTLIRHRCYYTLDAFVKLMALMIRHSDNGQSQNKINLLKKLLNIIVGVLHMDHEVRKQDFNAMPYHRILISLFNEITGPDPLKLLEPIAWSILEAFGQTFFALQPRRMPGFAFAWLDIVGHRNVIGRLLANTGIAETVDSVKTAATYTQLIISHLKFLAPFLRNIQLPKSIAILYKGTLRVLLVILHDFPELLCEFHYVICDTIPPNCVQLRNLILSAYPRQMRLPDPFALNFKQVDTIQEMAVEPKSNLNMATIIPDNIRNPLDEYLSTRTPVDFLPNLPTLLQTQNQAGTKYNTTVMNALVLYVGIRAIEHLHLRRQRISTLTIAHTSFMDIFQNLAIQLDTEGRYLLFNGIANQLRYPNAHTHYFSCVFLYLFKNSTNDTIQEQITRILFERLVALRPHPWGLLITFIELIKNPTYNFWRYEFTSCAPEIQRLFQNVANTCVPAQGAQMSQTQSESASGVLGNNNVGASQQQNPNSS